MRILNNRRVAGASALYLTHLKANGRKKATLESYEQKLKLLTDYLKNPYVESLSNEVIDKVLIAVSTGYPGKAPRSPATLNQIRSLYKGFLKWCFQEEYLTRDISHKIAGSRASSRKTCAFSREEIINLLRSIKNSGLEESTRDHALFSLYAFTSSTPW